MSYLDYNRQDKLQLLSRNEGQIKSYQSCSDVRAWSHDACTRSRYLREWIKCDMPICILPVATLLGFFTAMTCKRGGKTTPRCHPDCKSKAILDSIVTTCDAIRECLKADESLEKFFIQEELETSHWPCERSLEALKSIKMFWKIILEKEYAVNLTKSDCYVDETCCAAESVRDLARLWQKDMVHQAMFVRLITSDLLSDRSNCGQLCVRNVPECRIPANCSEGDAKMLTRKCSSVKFDCCSPKKSGSSCRSNVRKRSKTPSNRHQCTTAKVSCIDIGNDPCCCDVNVCTLQKELNCQKILIEQLKKENAKLKCQLQNTNCCKRKARGWGQTTPDKDCTALIPKPFECIEDNGSTCSAQEADSELLITMKNCKHKSFRHVNLLQVLHKSNDPCLCLDVNKDGPCFKNEDPVDLLNRVQLTLGAMVKKEMKLANCKKRCGSNSEIEASYRRVNDCKSEPSCTCSLG